MSRLACLILILFLVIGFTSPASALVSFVQSSASRITTLVLDFGCTSPALALLGFVQPSDSWILTHACPPRPRDKSAPSILFLLSDPLCMTPVCTTDNPRASKSHRRSFRKPGSNAGFYPRLSTSSRSSFWTKHSLRSSGTSQRPNVISCVTVHDSHDSDSSTSSPLSPRTTSHPTKNRAVIMPSVKSQPAEGAANKTAAAAAATDEAVSSSGKLKKVSVQSSGWSGDSTSDRPHRAASSRSQPLNLSQVQPSVVPPSHSQSGSSGSLRRQPTYPPPVSSHSSYRLHESALFTSAPNLYAYPASAALASVSQAVDQMQSGPSRHGRPSGAYSSLALLQKNGSLTLGGSVSGQFSTQQQAFHRSTYQRKLNQYPAYL